MGKIEVTDEAGQVQGWGNLWNGVPSWVKNSTNRLEQEQMGGVI